MTYHFYTGETDEECTTCQLPRDHGIHRPKQKELSMPPVPDFNESAAEFVKSAAAYMAANREFQDRIFIAALAHARARRLKQNAGR